nr:uncharacterized protein LOC113735065 [Coffea arabica]
MCAKVYALRISQQMAFNQSFFLVLVLLASSVVLGKVEAAEATETTNAVKTASRKMLPIGGQIIKMLGVRKDTCIGLLESCKDDPYGCCPGCVCLWPGDLCRGDC